MRGRGEDDSAALHVPDASKEADKDDEWLSRRGRNMVLVILLYVIVCSGVFVWFQIGRQPPKLLILSVSGLRHDYLSKVASRDAPFFTHFLRHGSRAEYLQPTFAAGQIATEASLFTGLYPDKHGILGEHFLDREGGELKVRGPERHSADDEAWWAGVIPLWNSAVKQWRKTAVINVHGGCVPFDGYTPTTCQAPRAGRGGEGDAPDNFSENLATALDLLIAPEHDYSMAIVHTDVLRHAAEHHGADSRGVLDELRSLDARLQQMDHLLMEKQLRDNINIVIVSDGGLTDTEKMEVVHIDEYLPAHQVGVTITGNGASLMIYTDDEHRDLVYGVLTNVPGARAYRRHEMPARYRLDHGHRAPDILLVAQPNTFIENDKPLAVAAASGYDDTEGGAPDMRGVMLGRGPGFHAGQMVEPVHAVDVYSLLAALIDVTSEVHSGSLQKTTSMVNW